MKEIKEKAAAGRMPESNPGQVQDEPKGQDRAGAGRRLLTVENLETTFQIHKTSVYAVRGASIHVDDGDILAVVGESGSGKSVLMKSIMGLLPENAETRADCLQYMGKDLLTRSYDGLKPLKDHWQPSDGGA